MPDLYKSYHSLDEHHPFRRFVSMSTFRRYILQGCTREQFTIHVVLFENIHMLPTADVKKWGLLHMVDENKGSGDPMKLKQALISYYNTLWLLVEPTPSQIKRILKESIVDNKGKGKDTELDATMDRLDALEDKDANTLWYTILSAALTGAVSFGLYVLKMFVSGAWSIAETGVGLIANNAGLVGEFGAAAVLNTAIERLVIPVFRDAIAELAYQQSLSDADWIAYLRTSPENPSDAELWQLYRLRRIPDHNELVHDSAELEAVEEDFRLLMVERPSSDLPGQVLDEYLEGGYFSNESIQMTVDSLEKRLEAGEQLSASEIRTLAELNWQQTYRTMNDLDGDLPDPLPEWGEVGDVVDMDVDIFLDAEEGEVAVMADDIVISIAEENIAVELISTTLLTQLGGGVIGIALGFGLVVYQSILVTKERNRIIGQIDDVNMGYDWRLADIEKALGVKLDVPLITTTLGDMWRRKTYRWSAREVLSESVLKYLQWRIDTPHVVSPSAEDVATTIG
jgi:hypothetical protein